MPPALQVVADFLLLFQIRQWLLIVNIILLIDHVNWEDLVDFQDNYISEGRRRPRLAEKPMMKPTRSTPEPAKNHLIY
jgi:hypothetical protein